jgi:hypothetical protein
MQNAPQKIQRLMTQKKYLTAVLNLDKAISNTFNEVYFYLFYSIYISFVVLFIIDTLHLLINSLSTINTYSKYLFLK